MRRRALEITSAAGLPVVLPRKAGRGLLKSMSVLAYGCVAAYLLVVLTPTLHTWGKPGRATFGKVQGWVLFGCYGVAVVLFALQMMN